MHYCCYLLFPNRARQVWRVLSIGPGFYLSFSRNERGDVLSSCGCSLAFSQVQFSFFSFISYYHLCTFVVVALAYSLNVRPPVSTR